MMARARFGFLLFAAVVALAPLPFGSYDPLWVIGWTVLLAVAAATLPVRDLRPGHLALLLPVLLIGSALALVIWLQNSPLGAGLTSASIWTDAGTLLGRDLEPIGAEARGRALTSAGPAIAMLLTLAGGIIVGSDGTRSKRLLEVIAVAGLVYGLVGVAQFVFEPDALLWREKTAYIEYLTTPFVNRNTAATYYGSCSVIWLVLLLDEIKLLLPGPGAGAFAVIDSLLIKSSRQLFLRSLAVIFMLGAVLMTGSRAGSFFTLASLTACTALSLRRRMPGRVGTLLLLASAVLVSLSIFQLFGGTIQTRIGIEGVTDAGRLSIYKATLAIIGQHPVLGTGLGTFAQVIPGYRRPDMSVWGVWEMAHDTYLEIASELGLPFTALLFACGAFYLARLVVTSLSRAPGRRFALSGFGVAIIGLGHSLVDFSLQIPGYAIVFCAIVGCGLGQTVTSRVAERSRRPDRQSGLTVNRLVPS